MKNKTASFLLAMAVFFNHPVLLAEDATVEPAVETPVSLNASTRSYPSVEQGKIAIDVTAVRMDKDEVDSDLKRKLLREFVPIHLTVINKTDKLLRIPQDAIFFIDDQGQQQSLPTEEEIFKEVKRNGVGRAALWAVPLGVISFDILAVPALVYSGVHTKVMNNGVKDNLAANASGGNINPDGTFTTYLLIPKKQAPTIKKIMLGRVINIEDEIETQYVTDIQNMEIFQNATQ